MVDELVVGVPKAPYALPCGAWVLPPRQVAGKISPLEALVLNASAHLPVSRKKRRQTQRRWIRSSLGRHNIYTMIAFNGALIIPSNAYRPRKRGRWN
jgi:hypothetical protein